ncbi:nitrogenase molybdenum-iron protein beta chain [Eubacterium uniforme]|uniref:Nitrogenase molybdenum-iron protein beta chain n=1 Tax=Eubacterium uniforme TaxID=39495 RepID=A0A1T4VVE3_9FIRM|nr:nitrogenase component 1 [Eubacterium uniforme]SKA68917.1 nitrogenase molybdenum-iron protein beta chain [Eubacterium uniforme]
MASSLIEQPRFACALSAQHTVLAIPKAHPILHSGPGCSENSFKFTVISGGHQGGGYSGGPHISCTNSTQKEIVFGGEQKLRNEIESAQKIIDADLFVVLTGCTADIVGDDTINVAKGFAAEGYPVVGTETAGFKGNAYYGHTQVVNSIIDQYVGNVEPKVRPNLVNVFTVVPFQNPYWKADLQELKSLLTEIGLEVNILYGSESAGVLEWKDIPNAAFNLLISPWVGKKTVEHLEKKYGTPYLHIPYIPVGAKETSRFLRNVAEYAELDRDKVEEVISGHERTYFDYFTSLIEYLEEYREDLPYQYYLVSDSNYALGVNSFLYNEFGMLPKAVYITDVPPKKYEKEIQSAFENQSNELIDNVFFQADGGLIQKDLRERNTEEKEIIFGSTWEKYLAEDLGDEYIELSLPLSQLVALNTTYVGYRGGIELLKLICNDIFE